MKLKIKVMYEWELEADEMLQEYMSDLNISLTEAKKQYEINGPHVDSLWKLDCCADNHINNKYKSTVEIKWIE